LIDPKIIDDLAKRFAESVPPGLRQIQAELEKNFHAVLQATFAKMDLVTREEFDVQQAVLARTRAKLEALEKQVAELEAQTMQTPKASPQPTRKTTAARKKTKAPTQE
jgi:BMFP domain-containing protein YqiC